MSQNIDVTDIKSLDRKLIKLEEDFKQKLDKFWTECEKDILRQIAQYKAGYIKQVSLNESKKQGLEKLYKEYFRAVDKVAQKITRAELERNAKTAEEKERVIKLKVDKSQVDYLERAKFLSNKQFNDYQDIINKKLQEAKRSKGVVSSKDYKKIVSEETQKFKNIRVNLSAENESNRIANNIREELGKNSETVIGIIFNAIVDERTTEHICLPRHKVVLKIDDSRLIYFKPPLHPHCRSYWTYIYKGSTVKFTPDDEIDKIIFADFINLNNIKISDDSNNDEVELFGIKSLKPKIYPKFNTLSKGIKYFRKEIINSTKNIIERYFILDKDGNYIYDEWGTESGVGIKDSAINKIKSARLFIHNHPSGASFSEADIIVASVFNIVEFRAISVNGIHGNVDYIMRNAGNIKLTTNEKQLIANKVVSIEEIKTEKIKETFYSERLKVVETLKNRQKDGKMDEKEYRLLVNNLTVERVCKRLGIIYERVKY